LEARDVKRTKASPTTVRGIGEDRFTANKYIIIQINFIGKTPSRELATAISKREVLLMPNLKTNMLLGVDSMTHEKFDM
jgi:hypothetical protein